LAKHSEAPGDKIDEAPTTYFYLCVLISSIGAFVFGCALGFTSPTLVANKAGKDSACPTINCSGPHTGNHSGYHSFAAYAAYGSGSPIATDHCNNADKMNCELQFSQNFQSLFGSVVNFGCLAGALAGGSIVDKYGKRFGMILSLGIHVVGWSLVYWVPAADALVWDGVTSAASNEAVISTMLTMARLVGGHTHTHDPNFGPLIQP